MRSYKKMGFLFLALVIALAGIGVGYAAWTDSVTIAGTVNTGSVDLVIERYSGTWVYKDLVNDGDAIVSDVPLDTAAGGLLLVASSWAEAGTGESDVMMTWDNLFPSIDFKADVVLHYVGTIPAKVNQVVWNWQGDADLALLDFDVTATIVDSLDTGRIGDIVDVGYQLHYCDYIELVATIHVPQNNDLMGLEGTAEAFIEVVQWNEFPYPAPSPN